MEFWHAYIDESYNSTTFCVGGFLAREGAWDRIARAWSERIAYENRTSAKKGFQPIRRYHATDCANLKREFSENNGWSIPRQIALTKRICKILGDQLTVGIVIGGSLADLGRYNFPESETPSKFLYSTCFKTCLLAIAGLMRSYVVDGQVKVFYERGEFEGLAKEAFDMAKNDKNSIYRCLVSAESKGWEDCVSLQAADFMAYEGFQRVAGSLKAKDQIKKSLQALLKTDNPIFVAHFQDQNFADIVKMIENQRAGVPLDEGVKSGLQACHGSIPYIPGVV